MAKQADRVQIVGAGLSGAVVARELAEAGQAVRVVEASPNVGGNCHTTRDAETGVMFHHHGPHIFHTNDTSLLDYMNRFATIRPIHLRVRAHVRGGIYSLPINLHTINQFFKRDMRPAEAEALLKEKSVGRIETARSFREVGLASVGSDLFDAFFEGYATKQWGLTTDEIPASVMRRLPVRFDYNDGYFHHAHQGVPVEGYTALIAAMLDHPLIDLALSTPFEPMSHEATDWLHTFYSGALDGWFGYDDGALAYRTLDFETTRYRGPYQGCAVVSEPSASVPYTRSVEHRYLAPWETWDGKQIAHDGENAPFDTIVTREFPRMAERNDTLHYPLRLVDDKAVLGRYVERAERESAVTFIGRLGTYRYLDMDVCVSEARDAAGCWLRSRDEGSAMPAFVHPPLPR